MFEPKKIFHCVSFYMRILELADIRTVQPPHIRKKNKGVGGQRIKRKKIKKKLDQTKEEDRSGWLKSKVKLM